MDRGTAPFSSIDVVNLTGCTYRQLDYWSRIGVIEPTREARGSGSQRRWSFTDACLVRAVTVLRQLGAFEPVLAEVVRAVEVDESLWERVVVVTRAGSVWPIVDMAGPEGWLVSLKACRAYVRVQADQLAVQALTRRPERTPALG